MAYTFDSNIQHVAYSYIHLLKIKVTESSLHKEIEENPFYPSLFSVSDTFDKFHIDNAAYNISSQDFADMEPPFIALAEVPEKGSDFVLVTHVSKHSVTYIYSDKRPKIIQRDQFINRFKGIVFWAAANESSGEEDFYRNSRKERIERKNKGLLKIAFAISAFSIAAINFRSGAVLSYCILYLIKLSGLFCSIFLLGYEVDKSKGIVKRVCSHFARYRCSGVLDSKAAKILGVSWSAIGFFYFGATTLILLTSGFEFSFKISLLSLLSSLTIPYITYSIYYQWLALKQWCPICIAVLVTLVAELIWSVIYFWLPIHSLRPFIAAGFVKYLDCFSLFLIPIIFWNIIKQYLIKAGERDELVSKYKRLLKNPDLFNSMLQQQDRPSDGWQALGINIGNPDAANTVVKVCNPFCGPCAVAHSKLESLIKHNNNVKLKIIFLAHGNQQDFGVLVAKHLLAIAEISTKSTLIQALNDWYLGSTKDYREFAAKYPINDPLRNQDGKLLAMNSWCKKANIFHTPTILVNGYMVPLEYSIDDLIHIF